MLTTDFIQIETTSNEGIKSLRYVNMTHIQQIYEKNGIIYIELTGYDTLEVRDMNLSSFMDRFIK